MLHVLNKLLKLLERTLAGRDFHELVKLADRDRPHAVWEAVHESDAVGARREILLVACAAAGWHEAVCCLLNNGCRPRSVLQTWGIPVAEAAILAAAGKGGADALSKLREVGLCSGERPARSTLYRAILWFGVEAAVGLHGTPPLRDTDRWAILELAMLTGVPGKVITALDLCSERPPADVLGRAACNCVAGCDLGHLIAEGELDTDQLRWLLGAVPLTSEESQRSACLDRLLSGELGKVPGLQFILKLAAARGWKNLCLDILHSASSLGVGDCQSAGRAAGDTATVFGQDECAAALREVSPVLANPNVPVEKLEVSVRLVETLERFGVTSTARFLEPATLETVLMQFVPTSKLRHELNALLARLGLQHPAGTASRWNAALGFLLAKCATPEEALFGLGDRGACHLVAIAEEDGRLPVFRSEIWVTQKEITNGIRFVTLTNPGKSGMVTETVLPIQASGTPGVPSAPIGSVPIRIWSPPRSCRSCEHAMKLALYPYQRNNKPIRVTVVGIKGNPNGVAGHDVVVRVLTDTVGGDITIPGNDYFDSMQAQRPHPRMWASVSALVLQVFPTVSLSRAKFLESRFAQTKAGDTLAGEVVDLSDSGITVDVDGVPGWIPCNEARQDVRLGQTVECWVMWVAKNRGSLQLSMKPNPWNGVETKYPVGQRVTGRVTNVKPEMNAAFIELEHGLTAMASIEVLSTLPARGEEVAAWVESVKPGRIKLTLVQPESRDVTSRQATRPKSGKSGPRGGVSSGPSIGVSTNLGELLKKAQQAKRR